MFWELIPTFVEVTGKKVAGGNLFGPSSWIELKGRCHSKIGFAVSELLSQATFF